LSRFSVAVYGSFDAVLSDFSKVIALSDGLDNSHFCCQVAPHFLPNFDKKIAKSQKIGGKVCSHHFV